MGLGAGITALPHGPRVWAPQDPRQPRGLWGPRRCLLAGQQRAVSGRGWQGFPQTWPGFLCQLLGFKASPRFSRVFPERPIPKSKA